MNDFFTVFLDTAQIWFSYAVTAISVGIAIWKFVSSNKYFKEFQKTKFYESIKNALTEFCADAEALFAHGLNDEKKNYVQSEIAKQFESAPFDYKADEWTEEIDKAVSVVNTFRKNSENNNVDVVTLSVDKLKSVVSNATKDSLIDRFGK